MFTKGGRTDDVFFYDVEADGYTLDDKRDATPDKDDLPGCSAAWRNRDAGRDTDRTQKAFFVLSAQEIRSGITTCHSGNTKCVPTLLKTMTLPQ